MAAVMCSYSKFPHYSLLMPSHVCPVDEGEAPSNIWEKLLVTRSQ